MKIINKDELPGREISNRNRMGTTRLHLIRHGETQWNVEGRMQGQQDSPLTELGRSQAQRLRSKIDRIDVAYSSPSIRAVETAEIILNGEQQSINTVPELEEINLGIWEGIPKTLVKTKYPYEYKIFRSQPEKFLVDQSETFHDVQKRAVKALLDIARTNTGKSILIVSHTVTIKVMLAYFENRSLDNIWAPPFIGNGSHSIVEEASDGGFEVVLYGGQSNW